MPGKGDGDTRFDLNPSVSLISACPSSAHVLLLTSYTRVCLDLKGSRDFQTHSSALLTSLGDTSFVLTSSPVCSLYPKNRNFFWLFQSQANYAAPDQQRLLKMISEFIIKTITSHIYILLFKLSLFLHTSSFTLTKSPGGRHDRYQLRTKLGQRKDAPCRAKMKLLGFLTCVSFPQETCLLSICYFPS